MQIGKTIKSTAHYVSDVFDSKFLLCLNSTSIKSARRKLWSKMASYRKLVASCSFSRPSLGVYPPWPWLFREPGKRSITLQSAKNRTWTVLNCSHLRINEAVTLFSAYDVILHGKAIRVMSKNEYDVVYDSRYLFNIRDVLQVFRENI